MNAKKEPNGSRVKERNVFPTMFFGYYTMAVRLRIHTMFCNTPFSLMTYKGSLLIMCVTAPIIHCSSICNGQEIFTAIWTQYDIWIYHFTEKSGSETSNEKKYDFANI